MVSASQIREVIVSYEQHHDSSRFVLEFSKLSFDVQRDGSPEAIRLSRSIENKLSEVHVGHRSVEELRRAVVALVDLKPTDNYVIAAPLGFFESVNQPAVIEKGWQFRSIRQTAE